jgi:hypothetical protein
MRNKVNAATRKNERKMALATVLGGFMALIS